MRLEVGGDTINAHRVVLASVSPYFYAMFNGKYSHCEVPQVLTHFTLFLAR